MLVVSAASTDFCGYPNVSQSDNVLEVFTDSDWANDKNTRRSVSSCVMFYGSCLLFSASRTQKIVSLSSAEAEVYACSSGSLDAVLFSRLLTWLTGPRTLVYVYTDSSGARSGKVLVVFDTLALPNLVAPRSDSQWSDSTLQRQWTQILLTLALSLSASRPSWRLGLYNTPNTPAGALERCDDPGRVFVRRQNVRALLSPRCFWRCEIL